MDIYAALQGVAAAVNAMVAGPSAYPILPDAIDPPTFGLGEMEVDYHLTFSANGLRGLPVTFLLLTSRGDTDAGRQLLSSFLNGSGPSSVAAAIEADQTLGGACSAIIVDRCRNPFHLIQVAGTSYLGAEIDVRIWGS